MAAFVGCALPYVASDAPAPADAAVVPSEDGAPPPVDAFVEVDGRLPVSPSEPFPTSSGVNGSTWIDNTFTTLEAPVAAGARTLELADTTTLVAGDVLLVWVVQGLAAADLPAPFVFPSASSVGRHELLRVVSVSGHTVELERGAARAYPAAGTQVVKVPQYTDLVIGSGTTRLARPWDGKVGGIVAFLAQGRVTISGTLSARGAGFGGGTAVLNPAEPPTAGCTAQGTEAPAHSAKGFGIAVGGGRFGVPALANAGGGGACLNAGGGGGASLARGGNGGRSFAGDGARDVGGRGGEALPNEPFVRFFLGGGGGAGEQDDDPPEGGSLGGHGGRGGGVILIGAAEIDAPGTVDASGSSAVSGVLSGGGGGGAGGTVAIRAERSVFCSRASASGGGGGSTGHEVGTGGGGGGGGVWLLSPRVACPTAVSGGVSGTYMGDARGGQAGEAGKVVLAEP